LDRLRLGGLNAPTQGGVEKWKKRFCIRCGAELEQRRLKVELIKALEGLNHLTPIIEVGVLPGTHIREAAEEVVKLVERTGFAVRFTFNGIELTVLPGTEAAEVVKEWEDRLERSKGVRKC